MRNIIETDVCVLGAGAAGLATALKLPKSNKVTVVSHFRMGMSSSAMAQDGIAAVSSVVDSLDNYVLDSMAASHTLGDKEVISDFAMSASAEIEWLEQSGVNFHKKPDGTFCLKDELGHSHGRMLHVNDETGKAIMTVLQKNVNVYDNIDVLCEYTAVDFISKEGQVVAIKLLDMLKREFLVIKAKCFVLATGGASGVFARNSNPYRLVGSGIALAWRAGCSVANMEFHHFHPTCFGHARVPSLFISGLLHTSGTDLLYEDGSKFTPAYDKSGNFLPNDVISRILRNYKRSTGKNVYIDVTNRNKAWVKNSCPWFYRACLSYGVDISKVKIPVAPAALFTCGGVVVDKNCVTKFKNLYAVGEVAHTGLHGADRLRATPLMECMVFSTKVAKHLHENIGKFKIEDDLPKINAVKGADFVFHDYNNYCHNVQYLMWNDVGILRNNSGLLRAKDELCRMKSQVDYIYSKVNACPDVLEFRNMVLTSLMIAHSAIMRKESRGTHYNEDYPMERKDYDKVVLKFDSGAVNLDAKYI